MDRPFKKAIAQPALDAELPMLRVAPSLGDRAAAAPIRSTHRRPMYKHASTPNRAPSSRTHSGTPVEPDVFFHGAALLAPIGEQFGCVGPYIGLGQYRQPQQIARPANVFRPQPDAAKQRTVKRHAIARVSDNPPQRHGLTRRQYGRARRTAGRAISAANAGYRASSRRAHNGQISRRHNASVTPMRPPGVAPPPPGRSIAPAPTGMRSTTHNYIDTGCGQTIP